MTPPNVLERVDPAVRRRWPRLVVWAVGAVLVVAGGLAAVQAVVRVPATVGQITFSNETPYTVTVEVSGGGHDAVLPIASVERQSTLVVEQVIDQGDTWTFHAYGQGADGGRFTVARADLAAADWKVVIPPVVGERLQAAGAPPTPE
jgi:hypothetical protein